MYKLNKKENKARLGTVQTSDGSFNTPAFMNVATSAAIKGGLSSKDLKDVGCEIMLSNTYHLHLRPGENVINSMGGLSKFTNWNKPTLTDSGGFQIFSLAQLGKVTDEGVSFASHIDGSRVFIGPTESIKIQSSLASSIAMAFDECIDSRAEYAYVKESCGRTLKWLQKCKQEMIRLNTHEDTINKDQQLFGINQGACFEDLRIEHMKRIVDLELDGYAIGGLAVGETHEEMYRIVSVVEEYMPVEKIRYLMGVGTPSNILEAVSRGVDLFDCVMPTRNGRHGHFFTWNGVININNVKYITDEEPIDRTCECEVCKNYSRGYIRHLFNAKEVLALRFGAIHNLYFYNSLMKRVRDSIEKSEFNSFYTKHINILNRRI